MTVTGCCYRKSPKCRHFFPVFWRPFWKWPKFWKLWRRTLAPLMVTYHYVKLYVSIIIHLEVININVRNFNFAIGFYSKSHPFWTPQNMTLTPFTTKLKTLGPTEHISITPPSFMKCCPVVPKICCGNVHVAKKERGRIIIIIIMITRYDYNLTIMKSQVSQTGHWQQV